MISAEAFSKAGAKYLGTPYTVMDCQSFYERCAADCGLRMDLKGANAWYRKFRETGWTGSPEECKRKFGSIPKGATLFIHAFDGGEVKRGYHDGLGNASHIGIKTGTRKGAIHSSETRQGVAESIFKDETIKNGGWNMVGLSTLFDYGDKINGILRGTSQEPAEPKKPAEDPGEVETMTAVITTPNKTSANMRQGPGTNFKFVATDYRVPEGAEVELLAANKAGTWWKCKYNSSTGWIKAEFLNMMDQPVAMDPGDGFPAAEEPAQTPDIITVKISAEAAPAAFDILEGIAQQIVNQIGRG